MKSKSFFNTIVIVVFISFLVVAYYFTLSQNQASILPIQKDISLTADMKSAVVDGKVILQIDDEIIFNWFKNDSQLCDSSNKTSTPDRKTFCEDISVFKSQTRFSSIIISPDKTNIGFTIESDTLSPDKVVGIFSRSTNKLSFLTNYYLGNEFISFSPGGINFVYQANCFEGMCGLFIKNSETSIDVHSINNPEFVDSRSQNVSFVRWISDNEFEYKLGGEIKREVF